MDVPFPDPAARPLAQPVTVFGPAVQSVPLVFASPHSGRDYPPEFIAAARLDPIRLRRSEDSFVDELFAAAPSVGAPLLAATFPRAFCDPNREPWELDPAMFEEPLPPWVNTNSPRVGAGLGTIPRVVASGETIYRGKLHLAEAKRRVRDYWEPFHATLAELIDGTRARFGACLLIDCHSMPANGGGARPGAEADFVLGDAYGTTCSPAAARRVEQLLTGLGYRVRRNEPYAGGYITRHYGRPREGVHALQVEIDRSLYMDEVRIERSSHFPTLLADLSRLVTILSGEVAGLIGR